MSFKPIYKIKSFIDLEKLEKYYSELFWDILSSNRYRKVYNKK
jgi:hypothetical protein